MAVDKLVDSTQLDSDLTSVANAIRAKSGGSGQLAFPAGFVSEIGNISGGGGSATLVEKTINANGTYNASSDSADGYSKVVVSVPASAVDSGTKAINANGTHDVTGYASASVNVPNSYAAGDEGKVVSNGALVSQTAHAEVTQNGTIDTTLNNSVTVNVSGGASLPTSISGIDGGTFTLANSTPGSNYQISHSLGQIPKGFIIWSESVDMSESGIIRGMFSRDDGIYEDATKENGFLHQCYANSGNFGFYARNLVSAFSGYANATYIRYNVGNNSYQSGITYKWLAWV